jgi:hypothetical protein
LNGISCAFCFFCSYPSSLLMGTSVASPGEGGAAGGLWGSAAGETGPGPCAGAACASFASRSSGMALIWSWITPAVAVPRRVASSSPSQTQEQIRTTCPRSHLCFASCPELLLALTVMVVHPRMASEASLVLPNAVPSALLRCRSSQVKAHKVLTHPARRPNRGWHLRTKAFPFYHRPASASRRCVGHFLGTGPSLFNAGAASSAPTAPHPDLLPDGEPSTRSVERKGG